MLRHKTVTCGKCLSSLHVYEDTHPTTWRCPTCSQVQGVLWKESDPFDEPEKDVTYIMPHLKGEGEYDWDWLNYDKGETAIGN